MVEYTTNGKGIITGISADANDDIVIPNIIGTEKIKGLSNTWIGYPDRLIFQCKSFSSKTEKPLKIKKESLNGIVASGNIDLRNFDFSEETFIEINLICSELIPPQVPVYRPAALSITADKITLDKNFSFSASSFYHRGKYVFKIGTLEVLSNNIFYFDTNYTTGSITNLVFGPEVTQINENAFNDIKISNIEWGRNISNIGSLAFGNSGLTVFPPIDFTKVKVAKSAFQGNHFGCETQSQTINLVGLKKIPANLFRHCVMHNINIIFDPEIESIEMDAFNLSISSKNVKVSDLDCSRIDIDINAFSYVKFENLTLIPSEYPFVSNSEITNLSFKFVPAKPLPYYTPVFKYVFRAHRLTLHNVDCSAIDLAKDEFNDCIFFETLDLSKNKSEEMHSDSFSGCVFLKDFILPPSIKTIFSGSFATASFEKKVVFPSCLETIEGDAFFMATFNQGLVFPSSLRKISPGAFNFIKNNNGDRITLPKINFGEIY